MCQHSRSRLSPAQHTPRSTHTHTHTLEPQSNHARAAPACPAAALSSLQSNSISSVGACAPELRPSWVVPATEAGVPPEKLHGLTSPPPALCLPALPLPCLPRHSTPPQGPSPRPTTPASATAPQRPNGHPRQSTPATSCLRVGRSLHVDVVGRLLSGICIASASLEVAEDRRRVTCRERSLGLRSGKDRELERGVWDLGLGQGVGSGSGIWGEGWNHEVQRV